MGNGSGVQVCENLWELWSTSWKYSICLDRTLTFANRSLELWRCTPLRLVRLQGSGHLSLSRTHKSCENLWPGQREREREAARLPTIAMTTRPTRPRSQRFVLPGGDGARQLMIALTCTWADFVGQPD